MTYIAGGFRAAYLIDNGAWYLKPVVDVGLTQINLGNITEHGANGASLIVNGQDKAIWSFSPVLEIGGQICLPYDIIRPYIRAGVTVFDDTSFGLLASFEGTPAGVAPFAVASNIDQVLGIVSVGVDALSDGGTVLKLAYDGRYGDTIRDSTFTVRGSVTY